MIPAPLALQDKTNLPSTPTTTTDKKPTFGSTFWNINENSSDVYERVVDWLKSKGVSPGAP